MSKVIPRPGVGIAVILTSDSHPDCVLLGKRKGKIAGSGLFQLPGGHLEFGESWEEAARREVAEETGMSIDTATFCAAVNSVVSKIGYHFVTIFMKAEVKDQEERKLQNLEPDKNEGWKWVSWLDMPEADKLFYALRDFHSQGLNPFGKNL